MLEFFTSNLIALPDYVVTIIISMVPFIESRAAVPWAILYYNMPPLLVILYSIIGGFIPAVILVNILEPVVKWLMRDSKHARRFFKWLFHRTHHKLVGKYEKYGLLALMIFVAIPLPGSGVWTGALAAFIFEIPKKKALLFIMLGAVIASVILAIISVGLNNILNFR
jgi:uncharacterized membrane protein